MNTALWVLQVLLAGLFFWDGYVKVYHPERMLVQGLKDVGLLLFIGMSEMMGAVGLIVPAGTRVFPWLTPTAAIGIAVIMVLAARFRLKRHEIKAALFTFTLMSLSLLVAYGRSFLKPL